MSTAHALGFGTYRNKGLVQIFENKNLWFDIGYQEKEGEIEDGELVTLTRTRKSSPEFLEKHSPIDDLIKFEVFDTPEAQTAWLVDAIKRNLSEDELIPDDVVVINPDPLTTKGCSWGCPADSDTGWELTQICGGDNNCRCLHRARHCDLTGIFRAKGNEAAMVYVINAQDCFTSALPRDVARVRNRLFTAITRSKAWVRVLGIGSAMSALKAEFERAKAEDFALHFRYPTEEERKTMTTINRDMSKEEQDRSSKRRSDLADIIASLESGESFIEDYPDNLVEKLQDLASQEIQTSSEEMTPKQTLKQINNLTGSLVKLSLSNEQNFPATNGRAQCGLRNYCE